VWWWWRRSDASALALEEVGDLAFGTASIGGEIRADARGNLGGF